MPIFSFLLFVFISSFTPGPNNFLAMTYANQHGLKKSMQFCFGVAFGFSSSLPYVASLIFS